MSCKKRKRTKFVVYKKIIKTYFDQNSIYPNSLDTSSLTMRYRQVVPDEKLSRYISNFILITSGNDEFHNSDYYIPNGTPALVYHKGDSFYLTVGNNKKLLPKIFIVGQVLESQSVYPAGIVESALVIFKPSALFTIFKMNMKLLNEMLYVAAEEDNLTDLNFLEQELGACKHLEDSQLLLENYFLSKISCLDSIDNYVDKSIEAIQKSKGMVSINQLAFELDINPRTLRLQFEKMVGVSPKQYAKVVRLNSILDVLYKRQTIDWQEIIFDFGYFDQAHFIKDFRSITDTSPNLFLKKNLEHIKMISGK